MVSIQSEGQRLLIESRQSLGKIAKACGVSKGTASRWKKGTTNPRDENRQDLLREYGIPLDSWDAPLADGVCVEVPEPNKGGRPSRNEESRKHAPATPPSNAWPSREPSAGSPYPPPPPPDAPQLDHIRHSLLCIRQDLLNPELSPTARSKVRNDESRLVTLVLRLEREIEMAEDRYVREHRAFREHTKKILSALKPFPRAARAVIEALE